MKKWELIHEELGVIAFLFVQNPHLTGVENIAENYSDEEIIIAIKACETILGSFSTQELVPFDAYPYEEALNTYGDQERAEEVGISAAEFRKNWNSVRFALCRKLNEILTEFRAFRYVSEKSTID